MGKAFDRLKEGLEEVLSITKGDQPAASITVKGHTYVPKAELDEALRSYDERNRIAIERAGSGASKMMRIAALESELVGCKIALEQAWENNRERQAELDAMIHDIQTHIETNSELLAENERLVRNAQTEAWLLAGYHRICERHGIAPSSAELIAAAKEVESEQNVGT